MSEVELLHLAALAFTVGALSAFNPCGFALLPAYAGVIAASGARSADGPGMPAEPGPRPDTRKVVKAAASMSGAATGVLATAGAGVALLTAVGSWLVPSISGAIGVAFIAVGIGSLLGIVHFPHLSLEPSRSADKPASAVLYGAAYALASLGCTLPAFLSVVAFSARSRGLLVAVGLYVAYASGLGTTLGVLVGTAAFGRTFLLRRLRPLRRFVHPAASLGLVVAGTYLLYRQVGVLAL